jgi:hypothetical protein
VLALLHVSVRFDEWGRPKRNKSMGEDDRRAREAAALSRLYGGSNLAPSEMVRQQVAGRVHWEQ